MNRAPLTHERVFRDEEFAGSYARRHQKMAARFGHECAKRLSSRGFRTGRILDAGCGSGGTALVLAQRFPDSEIVGIDLSEPLLRLANRNAQAAKVERRTKFEMGDVEKIPYANHSFDAVLNINMVHIVEDPVQMLNEIERVLMPGGFLFIADLRRSALGFIEKEVGAALTLEEAKHLLSQSKLRAGKFSCNALWWRYET
ncbi:MAG: Ubiquinone biosynthesis O-methyltransferase [bacterium]|nr:Ubiquinone biosynthesis O-methyltransferase [bacterium]MCK6562951.1 class I SAM-dependent methyltransferase [bacterium]